MFSGEATNTNLIGFGLTHQGLEPTINHPRGEHTPVLPTPPRRLAINFHKHGHSGVDLCIQESFIKYQRFWYQTC